MPERTSAQPMAQRARHRMCRVNPACCYLSFGEVAEWSKAPDLKSGVRLAVPWVRIPPSPPGTQNAPFGAFCVPGEADGVDEPTRVRQICLEQIWTAGGWPRAQRGVRLRDEPNNPTLSARNAKRPFLGRFSFRVGVCISGRSVWFGRPHPHQAATCTPPPICSCASASARSRCSAPRFRPSARTNSTSWMPTNPNTCLR